MHTSCSLTVCWSLLPGGCLVQRGVCSGGCLLPGGQSGLGGFGLGGVWSGGSWGGVCPQGGLVWGVVSGLGGGVWSGGWGDRGICSGRGDLVRGVWSGGCLVQGVSGPGVYPSMHWGRPPPLWTDRRLWKYYLGPTSLRPVKMTLLL